MKKYFTGIYCPPQRPHGDYPARNTERVFGLLKEAGVDNVFGYYEDEDGLDCLEASFVNAAKADVKFYPRLKVFDKFLGIDRALTGFSTSYKNFTEEEKEELHEEFEKFLEFCSKYQSFAGIFMGDERGSETFPGIGAAQRLFSSLYPDKLFMYNNLNYFIDDQLYFYSATQIEGERKRLDGELSEGAEHRFPRYDKFIGEYIKNVDAEYISTDIYPFASTWQEALTSIHRGLYEVQSFFADLKKKTGLKPLTYIQVGNWENSDRVVGETEVALHMGIAAAYDFDGFVFFPGCFPNDWLDAKEGEEGFGSSKKIGLLDDLGEPSAYYEGTKKILANFQKIGEFLKDTVWLGVAVTGGEFTGGFDEEFISTLKWNECIYRGGLPENEKHEYKGELPVKNADTELFVGAFEGEKCKKMYIIVNNTIVFSNKITLNRENINGMVCKGNYSENIPEEITLAAGESILIITK